MNSTGSPGGSLLVPPFPPVLVSPGFGRLRRALRDGRRIAATALIGAGAALLLLALASPARPPLGTTPEAADRQGPAPPEPAAQSEGRTEGRPAGGGPEEAVDDREAPVGEHQDDPEGLPGGNEPVFAPVRLTDPAVGGLLNPGDVVDILAAPTAAVPGETPLGTARRIAHRARVAEVPPPEETGPAGYVDGTLIVVEVSQATAVTLAGSMNDSHLTVTRW
ncbi:hypothetical protein [Streptomyces spiramenti]|uniref:Flp pilus assembly protein RcpC/CpaB domain-containing protein n=1 Tax=Streptomyces spiramenti TaxID=2720606 RepID=A0ABX1AKS4_9ACTN|nr:hypothetical protein [Streptomyces spiramenti]NJP66281.1 hypothetical protein [Streptomyces spiramenti]